MPGSSEKINYQIRPSKSIERKMLCEILREFEIINTTNTVRYIGMGARYFSDFLLLHHEFGINNMISIESDINKKRRFEFNKPLKCIEMRYGNTSDILPGLEYTGEFMNFIWLDYDSKLSINIIKDLKTITDKLNKGDLFFISFNYDFGQTIEERKDKILQLTMESSLNLVHNSEFSENKIVNVINNLLNQKIDYVIRTRNLNNKDKLKFKQLVFMKYSDGAKMLTIGGVLVDDEYEKKMGYLSLLKRYPYLYNDDEKTVFNIQIPSLTRKEIQLLLENLPISDEEFDTKFRDVYNMSKKEVRNFEKIYRYYPYYTEGRVNT